MKIPPFAASSPPPRIGSARWLIVSAACFLLASVAAHAQTVGGTSSLLADDVESNYTGWNGTATPANSGTGWGLWNFSNTGGGSGGYFAGTPATTGTIGSSAWGLYSNSGGTYNADRTFGNNGSGLDIIGDTVSVILEIGGGVQNGGAAAGWSLWNNTTSQQNLTEFYFEGGSNDWSNPNSSTTGNPQNQVGFSFNPIQSDLTITSASTYSLTAHVSGGSTITTSGTFSGGLLATGTSLAFRLFSYNQGNNNNIEFNHENLYVPTFDSAGNFSTTSSWASNGQLSTSPINGNNVAFGGAATASATNDLITTVNSYIFNAGAGAYTVGGANIFLAAPGSDDGGITNNSANAQTVAENLTIGSGAVGTTVGATLNAATGNLVVSGSVNLNGSRILVTGTNSTTISGVVSGAANILVQGTGGTLYLTNPNNSFGPNVSSTGNVVIDAGTVSVGATGALGVTTGGTTGYVNIGTSAATEDGNNSALVISTGGVTVSNPIDVRYYSTATYGTQTIGGTNPSGVATFAGPIALHNSATLSAVSGGTVNISGVISQGATSGEGFAGVSGTEADNGTPGITVVGNGTVQISSTSTYAGPTAVNGGKLIVSGSLTGTSSVTVAQGASIEVDGGVTSAATMTLNSATVMGTGAVGPVTANGGNVDPGLSAADEGSAPGTLTANGAVTLSSTTNFNIRVGVVSGASGDNDQLAESSGSVTLDNANLEITAGSILNNPANIGNVYVIINGGATDTGSSFDNTFAGGGSITTPNGYTFNIDYASNSAGVAGAGNDVALTLVAIPEPGTYGMVLGGVGLLLVLQRGRRRRAPAFAAAGSK